MTNARLHHVVAHSGVRWWAPQRGGVELQTDLAAQGASDIHQGLAAASAALHGGAAAAPAPGASPARSSGATYTFVTGGAGERRSIEAQLNTHGVWGVAAALRESYSESAGLGAEGRPQDRQAGGRARPGPTRAAPERRHRRAVCWHRRQPADRGPRAAQARRDGARPPPQGPLPVPLRGGGPADALALAEGDRWGEVRGSLRSTTFPAWTRRACVFLHSGAAFLLTVGRGSPSRVRSPCLSAARILCLP